MIMKHYILLNALVLLNVANSALHEPADGKHYIGAWLDTADSSTGARDGDRPAKLTARMNSAFSLWQYGQNLPIGSGSFPFPDDQIDELKTDALIILTVYPASNPWSIPDSDIALLASQCYRITNQANHRLFLRFGPEMNGNWNPWGQQPTNFLALWRRVYNAVKARAPQVAFIWAPSSGNGYPYPPLLNNTSAADLDLMDTNKDGVLSALDDPYSPYYPGDEYVDWVGASIYTYGTVFPWEDNIIAPPGRFESYMNVGNFYQTYAQNKNKPYMVTETGAAFHTDTPSGPGVGELAVKQSWWRQYLTNSTFLKNYPKLKGICFFEFKKTEEIIVSTGLPDMRDFRVTVNATIRAEFLKDLATASGSYIWANSTDKTTIGGFQNQQSNGMRFEMGWMMFILILLMNW